MWTAVILKLEQVSILEKKKLEQVFFVEYAKDLRIFVIKIERFVTDNALHRAP